MVAKGVLESAGIEGVDVRFEPLVESEDL